ncbi:MAG: HNH endonuclease [Planctomycetaceae bacterium]
MVRERAVDQCEYCRLPQSCLEATFPIDHISPRKSGGPTISENLELACVTCSLKKAARTHVDDPETGLTTLRFNPRFQTWDDPFDWTMDWRVQGLSPCGRGTVDALGMNRPAPVSIRSLLAELGRFPQS